MFFPDVSIHGHLALDGYYRGHHERLPKRIELSLAGKTFTVPIEEAGPCRSKPFGVISDEVWRLAADIKVGGGGPNSARAAALIDNRSIRYIDACMPEPLLDRALAYPFVTVRCLGRRRAPRNLVIEAGAERLICRSRVTPTGAMSESQLQLIAWGTRARCTLGNSPKDLAVAELLALAARAGRTELVWVLTGSFPPDFHQRVMMPAASTLVASADEVSCCTGDHVDSTVDGALTAIGAIRPFAPRALILITLGGDGVVAEAPGVPPLHVCLNEASAAWSDTQRLVIQDPSCLCGAGDAFAAGVTVFLATRRSRLPWLAAPSAEGACLAGCALAVRWLGLCRSLSRSDFRIEFARLADRRKAA